MDLFFNDLKNHGLPSKIFLNVNSIFAYQIVLSKK